MTRGAEPNPGQELDGNLAEKLHRNPAAELSRGLVGRLLGVCQESFDWRILINHSFFVYSKIKVIVFRALV